MNPTHPYTDVYSPQQAIRVIEAYLQRGWATVVSHEDVPDHLTGLRQGVYDRRFANHMCCVKVGRGNAFVDGRNHTKVAFLWYGGVPLTLPALHSRLETRNIGHTYVPQHKLFTPSTLLHW